MNDFLLPNHEIVGKLNRLEKSESKNRLILIFSIEKNIIIPYDTDLFRKLQAHIGHKIALFNVDNNFFVRDIEKEKI